MARFLADAAHELRTPLTALRGYTELYERDMLDEPGALDRAMSRIGTESERLERLVSSLLELARGTTASVRDHGRVDVSSIVTDVIDDIRAAHPERSVSADVDPDLVADGDHEQLHQAILNLVANACRHTTPPATIEIAARRTDDAITVTVVDNGPGVAAEHRERIFDPFFQADDARTNTEGSAGLGLALTAQIAAIPRRPRAPAGHAQAGARRSSSSSLSNGHEQRDATSSAVSDREPPIRRSWEIVAVMISVLVGSSSDGIVATTVPFSRSMICASSPISPSIHETRKTPGRSSRTCTGSRSSPRRGVSVTRMLPSNVFVKAQPLS